MSLAIISIDENTRIVVEQDTSAPCPRDSQEGISVFAIAIAHNRKPIPEGVNAEGEALDKIIENCDNYSALLKHMERKNLVWWEDTFHAYGTYVWYLDSPDVYSKRNCEAFLQLCIAEYAQWAEGEVYALFLEHRTEWTNKKGGVMFTWSGDYAEEMVSGAYLDNLLPATITARAKECGLI